MSEKLHSASPDYQQPQGDEICNRRPLDISTKYYFWKPFMAYFAAFELKAYLDLVHFPDGLILDLGCCDGIFGQMLDELIGFKAPIIGGDFDGKSVRRLAQSAPVYAHALQFDASNLPLKNETYDAVFSNAVLYCLKPNCEKAISEVRRILKKNGLFICTVPTHLSDQHYLIVEFMEKLGLRRLANFYRQRINKRLGNVSAFSTEQWCKILERGGMHVLQVSPYISRHISRCWSLLFLTPFRIMGILRIIPSMQLQRLAAIAMRLTMVRSYNRHATIGPHDPGDYILIISNKT